MTKTAYFIVATAPRTGSNLLCRMLAGSGVAGDPGESFNPAIEKEERKRLHLENAPINEYIDALKQEVMPKTGRFGFKLHAGRRDGLLDRLRYAMGSNAPEADRDVLEHFFPGFKVIYLMRDDFLAQAISGLKAGATGQYSVVGDEVPKTADPEAFDAASLRESMTSGAAARQGWEDFFQKTDITPLRVYYEDMLLEREKVFHEMLAFLGEENPTDFAVPEVRFRKQADETNALWYKRFLEELGPAAVVQAVGKNEFCEAAERQIARLKRRHPDMDTGMLEVQRRFVCGDQRLPDAPPPPPRKRYREVTPETIAAHVPMTVVVQAVMMKVRGKLGRA